jgi:hypothetical protein
MERITGGTFCFERDPLKAAERMIAHLDEKRRALGLCPVMYEHKAKSRKEALVD